MKLFILILNIFFTNSLLAQGTIFFSAELYGNFELESDPPKPLRVGAGSFTLTTDGLFSGNARFVMREFPRGVHITDRDKNIVRTLSRYEDLGDDSGAPCCFISAIWDPFALSPRENSMLLTGELYVHAPSWLRPGVDDVFGQIILVPEPAPTTILITAGVMFLSFNWLAKKFR